MEELSIPTAALADRSRPKAAIKWRKGGLPHARQLRQRDESGPTPIDFGRPPFAIHFRRSREREDVAKAAAKSLFQHRGIDLRMADETKQDALLKQLYGAAVGERRVLGQR